MPSINLNKPFSFTFLNQALKGGITNIATPKKQSELSHAPAIRNKQVININTTGITQA